MLVQKKTVGAFTGRIIAAKLTNGEEIIARVVDESETAYTFKRPLILVMTAMPGMDSQGQVAFAPWMLGIDEETLINLPKDRILFLAAARKDADEQYQAATQDFTQKNQGATVSNSAKGAQSGGIDFGTSV